MAFSSFRRCAQLLGGDLGAASRLRSALGTPVRCCALRCRVLLHAACRASSRLNAGPAGGVCLCVHCRALRFLEMPMRALWCPNVRRSQRSFGHKVVMCVDMCIVSSSAYVACGGWYNRSECDTMRRMAIVPCAYCKHYEALSSLTTIRILLRTARWAIVEL